MNLFDTNFLIIFVCGFVDLHLANNRLLKYRNKYNLQNSNETSQIQQFCQLNFYDTNKFCGIGIISQTGARCIKWKNSTWNNYELIQDTSFCHKYGISYYCATSKYTYGLIKYSWGYCQDIKCISGTSDKTCQSNIRWSSTSSSIEIDYSNMSTRNKFLIFAYVEPNGCLVSKICENCDSTDKIVNKHFSTCAFIKKRINNGKVINFRNLSQETKYTFYLIPVFNDESIGHMAKLSLKTKQAVPDVPSNLRIIDRTTKQISLQWDKPQQTKHYGPVKLYLLEMTSNIDITTTYKTSINNYTFQNLQPCQNYCFILVSVNDNGYSSRSESKCFSTKFNFGKVILDEICSYFSTSRQIKWRYNSTNECPVTFIVQYYKCNSEKNFTFKSTSFHHIELIGLLVNEKYCVRVKPKIGNENGTFSRINEFYTRDKTPNIHNFLYNETFNQINISFEIDCSNELGNSIYRLILSNGQNECFHQAIFLCENCPYKFQESHINSSQLIEYQQIKNCSIIKTKIFNKTDSKFFIEISKLKLNKIKTNASISIYSFNPSGMHQIMKRGFHYFHKQQINEVNVEINEISSKDLISHLYLLIAGVIVLSIVTIAFIAVKKFNSSKLTGGSSEIRNDVVIERYGADNQSELVHELMKENPAILKEYKDIKENSHHLEKVKELTTMIANMPENKEKNRFKNILPFDQTRVLLKENSSKSDYINANHIPFKEDPQQIEYIAAQGPNEASISDFWLMVWEQNISIIVMLTKTYEDGKEKCIQYWPDELNNSQSFGTNILSAVTLDDETVTEVYIERKLSVKHNVTNEKRNITHLQIEAWPDYSVPKLEDFELFIYRFHQIISSTIHVPYLIHCSAGVGRTGTFIVIDRIIRKMESERPIINIQEEVLELRQYRKFMVQRQAQYVFIYDFIKYFMDKYVKKSDRGEDADIYFNIE